VELEKGKMVAYLVYRVETIGKKRILHLAGKTRLHPPQNKASLAVWIISVVGIKKFHPSRYMVIRHEKGKPQLIFDGYIGQNCIIQYR